MISKPIPYILWWAVLMHLSWGVSLLLDHGTSALIILVGLHWIVGLHLPDILVGIILIVISVMAGFALWMGRRVPNKVALLLIMPQQIILLAAFVSDLQTIIIGVVDGQNLGQPIDRILLFTILWPVMIAAVLHTAALIERHSSWLKSYPQHHYLP